MSLIENRPIFEKLVSLVLYGRSIEQNGGIIDGAKIVKDPSVSCCLYNKQLNDNTIFWWRCELYPDFPHHNHKMSIGEKVNNLSKGCHNCQRFVVNNSKFSGIKEVKAEWDWEANIETPDQVAFGSDDKRMFRCFLNHSYECAPSAFKRGRRCGICAGKVLLRGFNTFETAEDSEEFWDDEANEKEIWEYPKSAHVFVNLRCPKYKHKFSVTTNNFTNKNSRCPYCSCQRPLAGFNTFELVKEAPDWYDHVRNIFKITELTRGSNVNVWFKCPKLHSFVSTPNAFKRGNRCPYCSHHRIIPGETSLDAHAEAPLWWDYIKNKISITKVAISSNERYWFKCPDCDMGLHMKVNNFTSGGVRCKYCITHGYSRICIEWLKCIEHKYNIDIQYAGKPKEYDIPTTKYKADGFIEYNGKKIIFEYHGDYYHGYKGERQQDEMNKKCNKTFGQLYADTLRKEQTIRNLGYTLVVIWGSDYEKEQKNYLSGNFTIPELEIV
ncbi:hypothetical protein F-E9_185 [Faustovirus]|nr:hypothetical protein F-E9_185 [Faustovirus]